MSAADSRDPLRNRHDPLRQSGPDQQLALFRKLAAVGHGFSSEEVAGAAVNLLINALRQAHATRRAAEAAFDQRAGRAKQMLLDRHYDAVSGKRLNIFPFTQNIDMAHFVDKDR